MRRPFPLTGEAPDAGRAEPILRMLLRAEA
jgi:hypothetical protein